MKNPVKIAFYGLPETVMDALGALPGLALSPADSAAVAILDAQTAPALPPALPVLKLARGRPMKAGALLRLIERMAAEPSLYLAPFTIGPYVFDPQEKTLARGGGAATSLTDKEIDILLFLSRRAGGSVSRADLLKGVWQYQDGIDTHTLETHIYRLRQKLEEDAAAPRILVTDDNGYKIIL